LLPFSLKAGSTRPSLSYEVRSTVSMIEVQPRLRVAELDVELAVELAARQCQALVPEKG
jgi:hypothetical protein